MIIFTHDNTLDGLLTALFEAYSRKSFPDRVQPVDEALPLFYDEVFDVVTDTEKAGRVWQGLKKKFTGAGLSCITYCWLSEQPGADDLLFRYMRKTIDAPLSIEMNFGDTDVLAISKLWKKVGNEQMRVQQFMRFQKTADGIYFGAMEPIYNVFPLTISHFKDRFADQHWIIYDLRRAYGYYYDLKTVEEIRFEEESEMLRSGILSEEVMDKDEKLFQQLWKQYFKSIAIQERKNPKLHRQHLPARFWKYLTEKQD